MEISCLCRTRTQYTLWKTTVYLLHSANSCISNIMVFVMSVHKGPFGPAYAIQQPNAVHTGPIHRNRTLCPPLHTSRRLAAPTLPVRCPIASAPPPCTLPMVDLSLEDGRAADPGYSACLHKELCGNARHGQCSPAPERRLASNNVCVFVLIGLRGVWRPLLPFPCRAGYLPHRSSWEAFIARGRSL